MWTRLKSSRQISAGGMEKTNGSPGTASSSNARHGSPSARKCGTKSASSADGNTLGPPRSEGSLMKELQKRCRPSSGIRRLASTSRSPPHLPEEKELEGGTSEEMGREHGLGLPPRTFFCSFPFSPSFVPFLLDFFVSFRSLFPLLPPFLSFVLAFVSSLPFLWCVLFVHSPFSGMTGE